MLINHNLPNIYYLVSRQTISMLNKNLNNFSKQQMISSKRDEGKDDSNERKIFKMKELQRTTELEIDRQKSYFNNESGNTLSLTLERSNRRWIDLIKSAQTYYDYFKISIIPLFFKSTDEIIKDKIIKSLKEVRDELKELYDIQNKPVNIPIINKDFEVFEEHKNQLSDLTSKINQTYQIISNNKDKIIEAIPVELINAFEQIEPQPTESVIGPFDDDDDDESNVFDDFLDDLMDLFEPGIINRKPKKDIDYAVPETEWDYGDTETETERN
jgi:hypothetical protein